MTPGQQPLEASIVSFREYPADLAVNYHASSDVYSREHWDNHEGALCPSRVEHVQPVRLRNTEGRWRVIVNKVALYNQVSNQANYLNMRVNVNISRCNTERKLIDPFKEQT